MTLRGSLWAYVGLCSVTAFAQGPGAPSFEASRVLFVDRPVPLAPGVVLSIFGSKLGPSIGCEGAHDPKGVYPQELCGAEVLVGGAPAGLLYVRADQINFQVPQETPTEGTTDLAVVYQGRSSKAVAMPLGIETEKLLLDGPARVGMPVWLRVKPPYNRESDVRYPFMIFPASFGCNEVEVRRNGVLLPRIADMGSQAFGGITIGGFPCGSIAFSTEPHFKGRLPLHLQYRFDQPGIYQVRRIERRPFSNNAPKIDDWTEVEILPEDVAGRQRWRAVRKVNAPDNAADLVSDFLPGILGVPDDESLDLLIPYLYHPDRMVREYAMYGLTYWPVQQAANAIRKWMSAYGSSDATEKFLQHASTKR